MLSSRLNIKYDYPILTDNPCKSTIKKYSMLRIITPGRRTVNTNGMSAISHKLSDD